MDVAGRAAQLRGGLVPHALATVVRARRPSSGKPGDRAIVTADRRVEGWVGGACVESVVVAEGLAALAAGTPRYVVVDSDATGTVRDDDRVTHPLHCDSGGAVELFIEPFTPPLPLAIVGDSPVARALAVLGEAAGLAVTATADPDALTVHPGGFVVVASMGRADEGPARAALLGGAPYVAVVASRRRAASLRTWLAAHGVADEALAALHAPAGLDLGARTPEGVAVSILAEVVAEHARLRPAAAHPPPTSPAPDTTLQHPADDPAAVPAGARDPVCGMTVAADAQPSTRHEGRIYRFCGDRCRQAFLGDPSAFLAGGT